MTISVTFVTEVVINPAVVVTNPAENESRDQNETKARPNNPMIRQDQPVPGRLSHLNRLSHPVQTIQTIQTILITQTILVTGATSTQSHRALIIHTH